MPQTKTQNTIRALIVDDEKSIRKFLSVSLSSRGYTVSEAVNGKQAIEAISLFRPDFVILDLGLPDMDGNKVLEEIRNHSNVPIIILSVRDRQEDKIKALDKGADDYLTKPFGIEELYSRLKAVLRRTLRIEDEPVFKSGKLYVDLAKRTVKICARNIELTPTEYDILKLMVMNAGRVMTHRQLIKQVWNKNPDEYMDHLLRVTISNLRSKIEPDSSKPEFIITEPAVGYRLQNE
ncbi:MAG: KDP operon transcriptional regulatory protein KdpE [Elusimicrobia bacterium ADurb.Bin231]|nr:MAG: KDP operon transcriptional regulatory protein KdpE [Elusimicrobia bacterium ADurb.Bin231]